MKHLKEKKLFKRKRTWMIVGATLMVTLGAGFVVLGVTSQQSVFAATDRQRQEVKSFTAAIFSNSSNNNQRLSAIKRLGELEVKGNCRGEWWNGWQQSVLPPLKKASDKCEQDRQKLDAVVAAAGQAQEFLQYDTAVTQQIATLAISSTKQNWQQAALKDAQKAQAAIKSIRTPKSSKDAQKAAVDRLGAIITSWNSLNAASAKQDKTAYLDAEGKLKQAYADLGAVADASDAGISKLVSLLKQEANRL